MSICIPHTCQWARVNSRQNTKNGPNGPKFSIFYGKRSTDLKKVHDRRSWRLWQIWAMSIGSLLVLCQSGPLKSKNVKGCLPVGYGRKSSWYIGTNIFAKIYRFLEVLMLLLESVGRRSVWLSLATKWRARKAASANLQFGFSDRKTPKTTPDLNCHITLLE